MRTLGDNDPEMNDALEPLPPDGSLEDSAGSMLRAGGPSVGDALDAILWEMHELGQSPAPQPSPELSALLQKGLPDIRRRRARRRNVMVGAAVVGAMTVSLTGIAAANDSLPGRSQGVVAGVINGFTPFHVDDRHTHPVTPSDPAMPSLERPGMPRPARSADPDDTGPGDDRGAESPVPGLPGLGSRVTESGEPEDSPGAPVPTPAPTSGDTQWGNRTSTPWGSRTGDDDRYEHRSPTPTATSTSREADH